MSSSKQLRPLYVQVHPDDTVAIIVNEGGLPAGTQFDSGLVLLDHVPEAHKVALVDIAAGAPILRYGSVIGYRSHCDRERQLGARRADAPASGPFAGESSVGDGRPAAHACAGGLHL